MSLFLRRATSKNTDLILVRAGPRSLHAEWMAPSEEEQAFDVMVLAYGPTTLWHDRADFNHLHVPGHKVAGYGSFLLEHRDIIARYQQVALIDDDIRADHKTLARSFKLGRAYNLKLWQPSLSWESYFSYAALLNHPGLSGPRYINFVEMMCPFFQTSTLLDIVDLFNLGAETGIDILWSCILGDNPESLAVLDSVSVTHTRPVGLLKAMNGFEGASYEDHIYGLLKDFGVTSFPGAISRGCPPRVNPSATMRIRLAMSALMVAAGAIETPMPKVRFLRLWATALRNVLLRSTGILGDSTEVLDRAKQVAAALTRGQSASG